MLILSDNAGSVSSGSTSGEDRDAAASDSNGEVWLSWSDDENIARANTVPLVSVFRYYRLRINEQHRKVCCPFKHHKGGRESTPSFWYYPEGNSFYCFGCHTGGRKSHSVEFVAAQEHISRSKAADKIIELFSNETTTDFLPELESQSERLETMMDFSNAVREFRHCFTAPEAQRYIEHICQTFDQLCAKREMTNDALRNTVDFLLREVASYQPSRQYVLTP